MALRGIREECQGDPDRLRVTHHSITRRNTQFDDDANLRFTDVAQNQDTWMTSSQVAH